MREIFTFGAPQQNNSPSFLTFRKLHTSHMWRKIFHPRNSPCYLCDGPAGHSTSGLCEPCIADLPVNEPACPHCAMPMPGDYLCPGCLAASSPTAPRICSPYRYAYPITHLVRAMKYDSRLDLAHCLGCLLGQAVSARGLPLPECLVPVPLDRSRLIFRGYNQSLEIARAVSRFLHVPLDIDCCRRTGRALPQTGLAAGRRRANVRGVFSVTRPLDYARVAIIDDVVTTGATVHELARALQRAGVGRIEVWACARTAGGD